MQIFHLFFDFFILQMKKRHLDNTGLLEDPSQLKQFQSQLATELEFLPRTPLSLDQDSGIKWRDKTKLERSKVKSFQSVKSSRETPTQSRTTVSFLDISPEPVLSTCTKNSEITPFAELSFKCTVKWLVDTVEEVTQSTLSRPLLSQIMNARESKPDNILLDPLDTQRSLTSREHHWLKWEEPSRLPDQPRYERFCRDLL
jgi:hypothetical protein